MTELPVTVVTALAGQDDLSEQDYRDIYDDCRTQRSLDQFVALAVSNYSKAWWSKYERWQAALTRTAKQELRRLGGKLPLPLTVAEATAQADEDAVVYRVGDGEIERVVMVGAPGELTLHLNGSLHVEAVAHTSVVTRVTGACRRSQPRKGISLATPLYERLNAARQRAGLSWSEFLGPLSEDV